MLFTQILEEYRKLFSNSERDDDVFLKIIKQGTDVTTLSCIDSLYKELLLNIKFKFSLLVVIYDDFIDNPSTRNEKLLEQLYFLPFQIKSVNKMDFSQNEGNIFNFCEKLWLSIIYDCKQLPRYSEFIDCLKFDIVQSYNTYRYSQMLSNCFYAANDDESFEYQSYGMVFTVADTMDLMASPTFNIKELAIFRILSRKRQKIARISNVCGTLEREIQQGDFTNDLLISAIQKKYITLEELSTQNFTEISKRIEPIKQLYLQRRELLKLEILNLGNELKSVDIRKFVEGADKFHFLYQKLSGSV